MMIQFLPLITLYSQWNHDLRVEVDTCDKPAQDSLCHQPITDQGVAHAVLPFQAELWTSSGF